MHRLPQLVECGPLPPMVNLLLTSLRGEIVLVESHDLLDRALNGLNLAAAVIAQLTPSVEQTPQVSGFTPTHFLVLILGLIVLAVSQANSSRLRCPQHP